MYKTYRLATCFFALGVSIALLMLVISPSISNAQAPVSSLAPIADTFVGSDAPTVVKGTTIKLEVDGSPIKIIYIKYDLSSLTGITINSAKLRFKVVNSSSSVQNVKQVLDTGWSETGVTYNTRPALGSLITTIPAGNAVLLLKRMSLLT